MGGGWLLWAACSGSPSPDPDAPPAPAEDTDAALAAPEAIGDAFREGMALLLRADVTVPLRVLRRLEAMGDGVCPKPVHTEFGFGHYDTWTATACTATTGAWFDGYSEHSWSLGEEEDGWVAERESNWSQAEVRTADGQRWWSRAFVDLIRRDRPADDARAASHETKFAMLGTIAWDEPGTPPEWTDTGPHEEFNVLRTWTDGEGGELSVEGWASTALGGGAFTGMSAVGFRLHTRAGRPGCETPEPVGQLGVRDPLGRWFDLRFQGDDDAASPGACDGCAEVWQGDVLVGTACPDLLSLIADLEPP